MDGLPDRGGGGDDAGDQRVEALLPHREWPRDHGAGVSELLPELGILVLFGAILLAMAMRTLERRA